MPAPVPVLRAVAHTAALAYMAYGYHNLDAVPHDKRIRQQTGGHWQFLTIQGLAVAFITLLLSLLADLFPSANLIISFKRKMLMVALPISSVVSTVYWSLITLAPNLIMGPTSTDLLQQASNPRYLPLDVDLALHAAPAVTLLLEFFLLEHKYSPFDTARVAPFLVAIYSAYYCLWIEYTSTVNGTFPYPFLNAPLQNRVAIYASAGSYSYISFRVLNALHSTSNGPTTSISSSSSP